MAAFGSANRVDIRAHYLRSINIRQDLASAEVVGKYIVTPEIQDLAEAIVNSVRQPNGSRAWAITGPYGSGKSSFALFLTDVLCTDSPVHEQALRIRRNTSWDGRLCPVIVTGHRGHLVTALMSAVSEAIGKFDASLAVSIQHVASAATADKVWDFFEQSIGVVREHGYNGLFVIIDEFGKFLEHAVVHPESDDLIALQYLAEEGDRRPGQFLLVTLLHSAFGDYVPLGSRVLRAEWQKIQGRFRDAVFTTSLIQHLTLLSSAIEAEFCPKFREAYDRTVAEVLALPDVQRLGNRDTYGELLRRCSPLHPLASLLTWPIFRSKMAQNERTLFSFLASHEYKGFSWFLDRQDWNGECPPFYRVADLYDYVAHALGSAVAFGEFSRSWSEIAETLDRIGADAPELTDEVVKTVGLLNMYGPVVGLSASAEVLRLAIGDRDAVDQALDYLIRNHLAIFRRFTRSYRLWEGSDVDLDAEYVRVKHQLSDRGLAKRLTELVNLRPLVARKHYVEKGTLRAFEVRVVDGSVEALRKLVENGPSRDFDGLVAYVLSRSEAERAELVTLACELTKNATGKRRLVVLAFPDPLAGLDEALQQLETWKWIHDNDSRIRADRAARQELKARIDHYRQKLGELAGQVFGLRGYRHHPDKSTWIHSGEVLPPFTSGRNFSEWLSALCDSEYNSCPVIPNELINRRYLSSAAVAARRNLMEAMLERPYEPCLGFTGGAAEATMYHAILAKSGIHKTTGDRGYFDTPNEEWLPVWRAIEEFLLETVDEPKPVTALYDRLADPPYGIRPGVVPILLLAFMIKRRHEVALYEANVYVPSLRIEVMERLTRRPEDFSLRLFQLDPDRARLLDEIAKIPLFVRRAQGSLDDADRLLAIVEPLVRFVSELKPYAKSTKRFNDARVVNVRLAILRATDPYSLIFDELPTLFDVDLQSPKGAQDYAALLANAILELENAYPKLLAEIENELYTAFGIEKKGPQALEILRKQAAVIRPWASESRLKRFVVELDRGTPAEADWREGIGRVIMDGIAPSQWTDSHVPQFRARIRLLAGDFMRLRELASEHANEAGGQVIRVSLFDGTFREVRTVTTVPPEWEQRLEALVEQLRIVLQSSPYVQVSDSAALRRAALARALVSELGDESHE